MRVFTPGKRVVQSQYGAGTVTAANEYHTVIDFDEHGVRTFSTRMVSLTETDQPAPDRPAPKRKRATRTAKV